MKREAAKEVFRRRAVVLEIGGFRPPDDQLTCWFGRVNFGADGEAWPTTDGRPMHALCQINLTEIPFRPPRLEDVDFITVFVGPNELPNYNSNGTNWCLRAYSSLGSLKPLASVETGTHIKPFPMRSRIVEEDYPNWEDVNVKLDEDVADNYYDHFDNGSGLKLGGWPNLVQSEIFWAPWNNHPASPQNVFQIDTTEKGN
ncbi:MAG: DUF1963 domain-containing protein [Planctomycetaceae bacterium]|jgi:hypothetical protein|nr:DUF1963 domain-containing protein [Planctomycetaceae bacterium]